MKNTRLLIISLILALSLILVTVVLADTNKPADEIAGEEKQPVEKENDPSASFESENGIIFSFPPQNWTVINNGGDCVWESNVTTGRTNYAGGNGFNADADSDWCGSGTTMDTELWTPVLDLSASTTATLEYIAAYNDIGAGGDIAEVLVSDDGGATWTSVLTWDADHSPYGPGELVLIDLTPYVGSSNVVISFQYAIATYDWWYQIDAVHVYDDAGTLLSEEFEGPVLSESTKSAPSLVDWGDPIHYTIEIVNTGSLPALNTVMTDVIPYGAEYISGSVTCSAGSCWYDEVANTVYWTGTVETTGPTSMPSVPDDSAPSPVLSVEPEIMRLADGSVDCAAYQNYLLEEPKEVAEQCHFGSAELVAGRSGFLAPTDTGYAQDIGFVSDNFVTFTLNDFPGQTVIGTSTSPYYGMDFDESASILYALNDTTDELGTIDLATGAFIGLVPSPPPIDIWTGLSIDPTSGVFYASDATSLYTIDPGTGVSTLIGQFGTTLMIEIAIGPDGNMYGHDIGTDSIYSIDKTTGTATLIGLTGYAANFAQGMDFDNDDGTLYIFLYIGGGANVFGTVDLTTGAVTPLATDNPLGEFEGAIQIPAVQPVTVEFDVQPLACGFTVENEAVLDDPELLGGPVYLNASTEVLITDPVYEEDFEADDGGFTISGVITNTLAWGDPTSGPFDAHSGVNLWATNLSGNYMNYENGYITSPLIDLSAYAGNSFDLNWWQWYSGENCCDYISVEVTNDGGATWEVVYGPYHGGQVTELEWVPISVDLNESYAVSDFQMRFHFVSDLSVVYEGWYVDDINLLVVTPCAPPDILVDAPPLHAYLVPTSTQTIPFDICNLGESVLDWSISEITSTASSMAAIPERPIARENVVVIGDVDFSTSSVVPIAKPDPTVLPALALDAISITHSLDQSILAGNSVSCNAGGLHTNNSYIRKFTLADFGITGDLNVTNIQIGIEQALAGAGGQQPATMNLYTWDPADPFIFANFNLIGTADIMVADQSLTIIDVPIAGIVPAGSTLVVEFFTPNGQADLNSLFVGSNDLGQTDYTYLAAADCGVPEPLDTGLIGFPNMHLVMNVIGEVSEFDIPWLSEDPVLGSLFPSTCDTLDVTFDSTGMALGEYYAGLAVNSNDPDTPVITMPVTMTVDIPAIELVKTVGEDPEVCADTNSIQVLIGSEVAYCYTVTNLSEYATLPLHDLVDSELGVLLDDVPYELEPGMSFELIVTTTVDADTTNEATWTAFAHEGFSAEASDSATVDVLWPEIELNKTVGLDPNACATTDSISVPVGTDVTYCFEVVNTGTETLVLHDLVDSELGALLEDFAYDLAPGASVFVTETVAVMVDTTNTATWTGYIDENFFAEASDTATVTVYTPWIYLPLIMKDTTP